MKEYGRRLLDMHITVKEFVNSKEMTNFVFMDSNSTPKRLPAEQGKKSVDGSFQKEAQDVRNGAPSLIRKSGWQMARIV